MHHLRSEKTTTDHKKGYRYITIHQDWISIHVTNVYDYQIDFDRSRTCKEVCNWLGQIAEKTWCNTQLLGELVLAFNEINGDLRGMEQ